MFRLLAIRKGTIENKVSFSKVVLRYKINLNFCFRLYSDILCLHIIIWTKLSCSDIIMQPNTKLN